MTVDYSGIPNEKDDLIKKTVEKYGKKGDKYQDWRKLVDNLPRASIKRRKNSSDINTFG